MQNMTVFNNNAFGDLRVLTLDGKEYFPATECARILGYIKPHEAINQHCRYPAKYGVPHPQSPEKTIEMNFINEGDLYRLIVRSKLPAAEKFERWVFDEVLPSIRKYGLYATDQLLDEIIKNPDMGIKLFTEYKKAKEKTKKLELEIAQNKQIIGELQSKATYYDLILQNKSLMPISKIAKDYGLSGTALNKILHELEIQYKLSGTWLLYQDYADKGYTQSKTHAIGAHKSVMHTYWTQKGRLFLYDLLKNERSLLPCMELSDAQ